VRKEALETKTKRAATKEFQTNHRKGVLQPKKILCLMPLIHPTNPRLHDVARQLGGEREKKAWKVETYVIIHEARNHKVIKWKKMRAARSIGMDQGGLQGPRELKPLKCAQENYRRKTT